MPALAVIRKALSHMGIEMRYSTKGFAIRALLDRSVRNSNAMGG